MMVQSTITGDQPLKIVSNELEFIPLQTKNNDKIQGYNQ